MQMVFLLNGLPGSGKSTWCKKPEQRDLPVVSRDIARIALGYCKEGEKFRGTQEQEDCVSEYVDSLYKNYLESGQSFIIDDTNTKRYYRSLIIDRIRKINPAVKIVGVVFNTSLETCIQRRQGQIPEERMREIAREAEPLLLSEVDGIFTEKGE